MSEEAELKICDCAWCKSERARTFNWTAHEVRILKARQKREEFKAKLADLGRSEETIFSSKVLEAYDLVHCPELREKPIIINIVDDKKVLIQRNGKFVYQD